MNGNDQANNIFLQDDRYRFESRGRLSTTPNSADVQKFAEKKRGRCRRRPESHRTSKSLK